MARHDSGQSVHHSAVVHYDNVGVRQVFQAVPLYRNRSRPSFFFAGEPSQNVGRSFIKSYCAVCLEGVIIVLACIIFSVFAAIQYARPCRCGQDGRPCRA